MTPGSDCRSLIEAMARALSDAGIDDARREARLILNAASGISHERLLMETTLAISAEDEAKARVILERRCRHEPLSRILGRREFFGREFLIGPDTLDPRPDSECVVETALEHLRTRSLSATPPRILDIGTGSGCLLLTLLAECPRATGTGTDISEGALATAKSNAGRLSLAERASWRLAEGLQGLAGPFDLLISNPPYIKRGDIEGLPAEVRRYDPIAALDGGEDGLDIYRQILPGAAALVPQGCIILEVCVDTAESVVGLIRSSFPGASKSEIRLTNDLAGRPRCVAFRRQFPNE